MKISTILIRNIHVHAVNVFMHVHCNETIIISNNNCIGHSPYTCQRQHIVSCGEGEDYVVESLRSAEMETSATSQATIITNTLYTVMESMLGRMSAYMITVCTQCACGLTSCILCVYSSIRSLNHCFSCMHKQCL